MAKGFSKEYTENVNRLSELEDILTELIVETDNEKLMQVFLEWQSQRQKCNQYFNKEIISALHGSATQE